jgi:prepilin-type N-terminal cleavage/methylation domain-containing protein
MKKNNFTLKHQSGFTIIELLIATSVFSVILLVATTGIIRIGQTYHKGITQARTQETTRAVSEEITRSLQFSGTAIEKDLPSPNQDKFCMGKIRYTRYPGVKVTGAGVNEGLIAEKMPDIYSCPATPLQADRRQLLNQNMRLLNFKISDAGIGLYRVDVRIAYGDAGLLSVYDPSTIDAGVRPAEANPPLENASCRSGIPASSFCATSRLDTLVKKRL